MVSKTYRHTLVAALVLLLFGVAVATQRLRPLSGADIVEGGSPLYKIAVDESIKGLSNTKDDKKASNGELCPNCGKVHPAPAAAGAPVAAPLPVLAPGAAPPCPDCGKVHAPLAPGQEGDPCPSCGKVHHAASGAPPVGPDKDYVYCSNCKVYHPRPSGSTNADLDIAPSL